VQLFLRTCSSADAVKLFRTTTHSPCLCFFAAHDTRSEVRTVKHRITIRSRCREARITIDAASLTSSASYEYISSHRTSIRLLPSRRSTALPLIRLNLARRSSLHILDPLSPYVLVTPGFIRPGHEACFNCSRHFQDSLVDSVNPPMPDCAFSFAIPRPGSRSSKHVYIARLPVVQLNCGLWVLPLQA